MNLEEFQSEQMPNKLIPGSLRRRLPMEEEVKKARKSLAYWWYRSLALNEGYVACCEANGQNDLDDLLLNPFASLYADMGDVRLPFHSWWLRHGRKAFAERQPLKDVLLVESGRQVNEQLDRQDVLVLSIPLTMRKTTAMRKISKLLADAHAQRPKVDMWAASTARRMIVKNKVRRATIEQLVRLWELRQRFPDDTLNELGVRARIELDLMARTTDAVPPDEAEERRRLTIAVSRLLKQARHLIENAGLGVFPSLKPPEKATLSG